MNPEKIVINGKTYKLVLEGGKMKGGNNNNGNNDFEEVKTNNNNNIQGGGKAKKGKKAKSTRKLSGYMKFCQTARKELMQEQPEIKSDIPAIGRALGAKWRALSDAEKAKY